MAKKKTKTDKLTEKEKENQRLTIPFDKSKRFITNLITVMDSSEIFNEWGIKLKSIILKSNLLKISFVLKDTAIEKEIDKLDIGQKRMGDFLDPDIVPDEELGVEVEE